MKNVTFAESWDHWTPEKTRTFPKGYSGEIPNEIAEAAAEAGVLETKDGGRPDHGSAKGGTGKA